MADENSIKIAAAMESSKQAENHTPTLQSGTSQSVQNTSTELEKKRKRDGKDVESEADHKPEDSDKRPRKGNWKGGFGKKRDDRRAKEKDMGRGEYFRSRIDKRGRNDVEWAKQKERKDANSNEEKPSVLPQPFTEEEIAQEERKPKRKVAVLIGYSGSGYKGMQISTTEKTIEGDLFTAFVKAGAISKANASDPKKSSLVRCARTDKGVHAAGNIISLKLIVDDPDIVQKINENLSSQIRVWGIERTVGSFSCYQLCDSRWYEYLLPTHALIPPHPSSYLGRKLVELAKQAGDFEEYSERQADISGFWNDVEDQKIQPLLETFSEQFQTLLRKALYEVDDEALHTEAVESDLSNVAPNSEVPADESGGPNPSLISDKKEDVPVEEDKSAVATDSYTGDEKKELDIAVRALRNVYLSSKKSYRASEYRLQRLQEILNAYVGTHKFHNYTIRTTFKDPSVKRHIKSFTVSKPFERNGTEWVSLKVHGQSFMMHQIRKMVGMAANMVRCGTSIERINESYENVAIAIPKAPGLGLLLERPVFDSYNKRVEEKFPDKEKIDFGKWQTQMEEFKQREIYDRIFREEEATNQFHGYFINVDTLKERTFLFLTSMGMEISKKDGGQKASTRSLVDASDDEDIEGGGG